MVDYEETFNGAYMRRPIHIPPDAGYPIYRTLISQTMRRPVWEPPDIDVTGLFEEEEILEMMKNIKEEIPDPVLRCEYLDLRFEHHALEEYKLWALAARRSAIACGHAEKTKFYHGLIKTILEDSEPVEEAFRQKLGEVEMKKRYRVYVKRVKALKEVGKAVALVQSASIAVETLDFAVGDHISVLELVRPGLWSGKNCCTGAVGHFLSAKVKFVESSHPQEIQPEVRPPMSVASAHGEVSHAVALWDYNEPNHGDLDFIAGDRISILEYMNPDWWRGRNCRTREDGIFPSNRVRSENCDHPIDSQPEDPIDSQPEVLTQGKSCRCCVIL